MSKCLLLSLLVFLLKSDGIICQISVTLSLSLSLSLSPSLPLPLSYLSLSHCSISLTQSTMPPSHAILVEHMTQMLQQSQSTSILRSVQKLISVAVERSTTSSLIRPTYIKGESTCTL